MDGFMKQPVSQDTGIYVGHLKNCPVDSGDIYLYSFKTTYILGGVSGHSFAKFTAILKS